MFSGKGWAGGRPGRSQAGARSQEGAALFVVLAVGVVIALVLMVVMGRSGMNRKDSVKNMRPTREFYLADAGFNFIKTRVTMVNREGGAEKVRAFLNAQRGADWQPDRLRRQRHGVLPPEGFQDGRVPLSVDMEVQGTGKPGAFTSNESVSGVLRVPSLARYARYVEGNTELIYTAGTTVDGEILAAGGITLTGPTVTFTRLVSTGEVISNRTNGRYDFGFRENQKDIPTLNHVHINSWDNHVYDGSKYSTTFEYFARNGGIFVWGRIPTRAIRPGTASTPTGPAIPRRPAPATPCSPAATTPCPWPAAARWWWWDRRSPSTSPRSASWAATWSSRSPRSSTTPAATARTTSPWGSPRTYRRPSRASGATRSSTSPATST